jgi:uncharacterized membrane protein
MAQGSNDSSLGGGGATAGAEGDVRHARAPQDIAFPGILLGVGLGGFVDGILLHQILQWHHMLTSASTANIDVGSYPPTTVHGLEVNTLWDGLFHTFTWLAVLVGLGVLYSRVTHARGRLWGSRTLWGWVLVGWGVFNLGEGIIDHHILGIHHVISGPNQTLADLAFLAIGAGLVLVGWLMQRSGRPVDGSVGRAGTGSA